MQTFISETIDDILLKHSSFEDCVFVLPSQRAGVFVKDTFKNKIVEGFLPEILTIESFIGQISEISKADAIQLLFHFYTIYCEVEEHPDSFDVFLPNFAFLDISICASKFKRFLLVNEFVANLRALIKLYALIVFSNSPCNSQAFILLLIYFSIFKS